MFNRIYDTLYKGSMVGEGTVIFALWPMVLAQMKPSREDGKFYLEINPKLVAATFGDCTEEQVSAAIEKLCKPDSNSRSQAEDGRRLVKVGQFEYWVVNGREYQDSINYERRKASAKEAMRLKREAGRGKRARPVTGGPASRAERLADNLERRGEPEQAERIAGMGTPRADAWATGEANPPSLSRPSDSPGPNGGTADAQPNCQTGLEPGPEFLT